MRTLIIILIVFVGVSSCKRPPITSEIILKGNQLHQRKLSNVLPTVSNLDEIQAEKEGPVFASSYDNSAMIESKKADLIAKLEYLAKNDKSAVNTNKKAAGANTKLSFKEKVSIKLATKLVKKAPVNTNTTRGFDDLNNNLKIGIILLGVAIVLSILSLGTLAGLAGLIGLIFLVLGLLNMYA